MILARIKDLGEVDSIPKSALPFALATDGGEIKRIIELPSREKSHSSFWIGILTLPKDSVKRGEVTKAASERWNPACRLCLAGHRSQLGGHFMRVLTTVISPAVPQYQLRS